MDKPKFKVGQYNIITEDPAGNTNPENYTKTIRGQMSMNFAVNYLTKSQRLYTVTHLPTGYKVTDFNTFKQAKTFIKQAEVIPEISTLNLTNIELFRTPVMTLINQIRKDK